jgi:protein Tex
MHELALDCSRIAQDLQIRKVQVESVVQLLDEGNTVPFITRYRKERTGGLNEEVIRQIQDRVAHLRHLGERKQTILKSIEGQGKLTDELKAAILAAETPKRLEDLYLPYKPKKRTLASVARERGLEPLAQAIWNRDTVVGDLPAFAATMVNPEKELNTPEEVLLGAQHILAEQIAETADVRAPVRVLLWETGKLATTKADNVAADQGMEYKDYFQFSESVRQIPPHRILAINRGEKENVLKVRMEWDAERVRRTTLDKLPLADHPHAEFLKAVAEDALNRLLLPSLEREIRRELTDEAEDHAVRVFARNLRSLLLQPPLRGRRVLAIDPGFRTGCKVACLDEYGNLLDETVVYPHGRGQERGDRRKGKADKQQLAAAPAPVAGTAPAATAPAAPAEPAAAPVAASAEPAAPPQAESPVPPAPPVEAQAAPPAPKPMPAAPAEAAPPAPVVEAPPAVPTPAPAPVAAAPPPPSRNYRQEAKDKLEDLVRRHQLNVIAIGNGTACRETEEIVSELIKDKLLELAYVIVNEAGASVYSASAIGREEFPNFDATLRGTISIGRRLQDPLSELVKVDPQNIGVGLYQHDIGPKRLKESLEAVIESCVNHVGVDLNTASVPLLRHVSGLNQLAARELVDYRKQNGPFKSREQLQQVPGIGPARYVQAAGFLKIASGDNPLDQTWIHPESYGVAQRLLSELGYGPDVLNDKQKTEELREKLTGLSPEEVAARLEIGVPTLKDILEALGRPGRDPREDLPPPIFRKGILKLEDLQPGMELKGTVLNVVDFGAFVDIGLKDSGLVHISQMANRYVKNPYDVVAVGDVVTVWVLTVDAERRRVSLTMIKPGTERKPPERRPPQPRPQQQQQPPREGRPPRGRRPGPPHGQVAVPGQGQGGQGGPRPGGEPGRRPLPPRRRQPTPAGPAAAENTGAATAAPPQPPRKPRREPPKPKLTKDALEGAAPLRTFSELMAFFEAKEKDEPAPAATPAPPPTEAASEPPPPPAG